jgi:hypothetical protein
MHANGALICTLALLVSGASAWPRSPRFFAARPLARPTLSGRPPVRSSAAEAATAPVPPAAEVDVESMERELEPELQVIPESMLEREDMPGVTVRELKDQTRESIEYFASERVPAALIAGATLGILFAYPLTVGEPTFAAISKRVYMMLVTLSLSNTLTAVFASSLAIVRLLGHEHEPMAKDPLVMMLRETPLLFLAVRVHYVAGLLSFVGALSVRMFTDYFPTSPTFAKGLVCLAGATLAFMLALYNSTLIHFNSYTGMVVSYIRVLFARFNNMPDKWTRPTVPLAMLSAALALGSSFYFAQAFRFFLVPRL